MFLEATEKLFVNRMRSPHLIG